MACENLSTLRREIAQAIGGYGVALVQEAQRVATELSTTACGSADEARHLVLEREDDALIIEVRGELGTERARVALDASAR